MWNTAILMILRKTSQRKPPFFRLPAELRNEIYRLLLGGITVHIDGNPKSPEKGYGLIIKACAAGDSLEPLKHLTGAAHSQRSPLSTNRSNWEPCSSDLIYSCGKPVRLDIQLLRVCRQMHNDASLIPYAENNFILGDGMYSKFRRAFCKRFSPEQRGAMQTVAALCMSQRDTEVLPAVLPGLKRLWIQSWCFNKDLVRFEVDNLGTITESFQRVGSLRLVGVGFMVDWDGEEDLELLERLEMALLKSSQSE